MTLIPIISADPFVAPAFSVGVAALSLTAILFLIVLLLRLQQWVKQQWRRRVLNRWRPILMAGLYQYPESLPFLSRFDVLDFLDLWNHLHESLGSEARFSLNRVAVMARVPASISEMLRRKNFERRLVAVRTAGNLRLAAVWDELHGFLGCDSPGLSLAAAQALTRIDAPRAVPLLLPHMLERDDWPVQRMAEILREADAGQVAEQLASAIVKTPVEKSGQLIRVLAEISPAAAAPIISGYLTRSQNDSLLIICLQALTETGRGELEQVRMLARHSNWTVRVHAASALGRLGTPDDAVLLASMLGDSQWWVSYRAARALTRLPGMTVVELLSIKDRQAASNARDMLHQAMAELDFQTGALHG